MSIIAVALFFAGCQQSDTQNNAEATQNSTVNSRTAIPTNTIASTQDSMPSPTPNDNSALQTEAINVLATTSIPVSSNETGTNMASTATNTSAPSTEQANVTNIPSETPKPTERITSTTIPQATPPDNPTATPTKNPTQQPTASPTPEPTEASSWLDLSLPVSDGNYVCGKNIKEGAYTVTCLETSWSLDIVVFENTEKFNDYYSSSRISISDEAEARAKHALSDVALTREDQIAYVNLQKGNVLYLEGGSVSISQYNKAASQSDSFLGNMICTGVFKVGSDIEAGQYDFYPPMDSAINVVVFNSEADYLNYHKTDRLGRGDESDAISRYAKDTYYISQFNRTIPFVSGNVVMINGAKTTVDYNDSKLSDADARTGKNMTIYRGAYNVSDIDIPQGQYVFTCNESDNYSMKVLIFNSLGDYIVYYSTSRLLNGEERNAIEQTAFADFELTVSEKAIINLHPGMIVIATGGSGVLEEIKPAWNH